MTISEEFNKALSERQLVEKELKEIRDSYLRTIEAVQRKRKWRPSEKAMTISDLRRKITALETAHKWITGNVMEDYNGTV